MSNTLQYEKTLSEKLKLNCDNTLPYIYDRNVERVETLTYLESFLTTSNETMGFAEFSPKKNKKMEYYNPKSLRIPILKLQQEKLNQRNNQNQQLGSFNKEVSLERKRATIEEKVTYLKQQKKKYIDKRELIKKEIKEIKIDLDFNENIDKFINLNEVYNKKKDEYIAEALKRKQSRHRLSSRKSSIDADMLRFTLSIQKAASDKKLICEEWRERIKYKEKQISDINENIKDTDDEINGHAAELKIIKNNLLIHYHQLLSEGVDARQEGLGWIIIAIWNLGFNIIPSFLPKFLDDKCIEYLFSNSILQIEYKQYKKELEDLKLKYKSKGRYDRNTFRTGLVKHSKLEDDIRDPFNNSSRKNINMILEKYQSDQPINYEKININSIKDVINLYTDPDENMKLYINKLKDLEKRIENKRQEIDSLKLGEMKRINREFMLNDYERRYNIKQLRVLTALLGIENAHIEHSKQIKEQRDYHHKLSVCKTFNFLDPDNKFVRSLKNKGGLIKLAGPPTKQDNILTEDYEEEGVKLSENQEQELLNTD